MFDFSLDVNSEQLNVLSNNMKYPEHYNSNCYNITNKHFFVDLTKVITSVSLRKDDIEKNSPVA